MGLVIFDTATTFNGWIADEENSLEWLFAVEHGRNPPEELIPADAAVLVEPATDLQALLEAGIHAHPTCGPSELTERRRPRAGRDA